MEWYIVAFRHPMEGKSVLYRQRLSQEQLMASVEEAIRRGANLLSIRGVEAAP